jgi:hypothetical protein
MKWLPSGLSICLLLVIAAPGLAQQPAARKIGVAGNIKPTPAMWFFEQDLKQYQDPKTAVRSKAEERSAQRRGRLASIRAFGFSNSRPRSGTDPYNTHYSFVRYPTGMGHMYKAPVTVTRSVRSTYPSYSEEDWSWSSRGTP